MNKWCREEGSPVPLGPLGIETDGGDTIKRNRCLGPMGYMGPLGIETGAGDKNKWYSDCLKTNNGNHEYKFDVPAGTV